MLMDVHTPSVWPWLGFCLSVLGFLRGLVNSGGIQRLEVPKERYNYYVHSCERCLPESKMQEGAESANAVGARR